MTETICLLLCLSLSSAGPPAWTSESVENDRNFSNKYTISLSERESCTVMVRKDGLGVTIEGSIVDECDEQFKFRATMLRAKMVNQKTQVIVLFFDNQLKKNGAPAPFSAMDKFLPHIGGIGDARAQFFLERFPNKLTTYSVLIPLPDGLPE